MTLHRWHKLVVAFLFVAGTFDAPSILAAPDTSGAVLAEPGPAVPITAGFRPVPREPSQALRRGCRDIAPPRLISKVADPSRPDDLMTIRDFGSMGLDASSPPGFAVSPSGDRLVVQVRQADPAANSYCQALVVFDLERLNLPPIVIPIGSELSRQSGPIHGLSDFQFGTASPLTPRWSPDGRWLAFVERKAGFDHLQLVQARGGSAVPVETMSGNVIAFDWSTDGTAIEFTTDEALQESRQRVLHEGRGGYRYDARFWIESETEPHLRGEFTPIRYRAQIGTGGLISQPARQPVTRSPGDGSLVDHAWVEPDDTPKVAYRSRPHVRIDGVVTPCMAKLCAYAEAAWLRPGSREVVFVRREGFAQADIAVYRWRIGTKVPVRIVRTADAFGGCELSARHLLCGRERSAYPRDIVAIDLEGGRIRQVVDLNPEWGNIRPARIQRLQWTNKFGIPAIGDLVLPSANPPGPLPLVVVQYSTRGFLRGGTGDEYPIRPLVDAGFAVLSVSRPLDYNIWLARQGTAFSQRQLALDWTDRASVHDSLLSGLREVQRHVPLDRDHIAIAGLSDGASTATYALIHSRVFSLALLSTCCEDPDVYTTAIGPAYNAFLEAKEFPVPWEEHEDSWRKVSLAMNARGICAEIQMQVADREARLALASFTKLRQAGVPMEMFVFPDEYHVKWQPEHRLAVYQRNMAKLIEWRTRPPVACFKPG